MATVKFQNGDIRENSVLLGKLRNDEIRNKMNTLLGKTKNDEIRNHMNTLLGRVKDGYVCSAMNTRLGRVKDYMIDGMESEKDVNIIAAYHFLVKKIF